METRNNNYVQMANQESNISQSGAKMSLLKMFKSKGLPKSCSRFLSLIVTLSVLSVANSTIAFPAKVRKGVSLYLYYEPHRLNNGDSTIAQSFKNNSKFNEFSSFYAQIKVPFDRFIESTLVDVLYCRDDNWCYISGYYSKGSQKPVDYYHERAWAPSSQLCEDNTNDPTNPLLRCGDKSIYKYDGIVASVASTQRFWQFMCQTEKNDKNQDIPGPWEWLSNSIVKDCGVFRNQNKLQQSNRSHSPLPLNEKSRVSAILLGGGVNNYSAKIFYQ